MIIKRKVIVFIVIILALTSSGILKENYQDRKLDNTFNKWFNSWVNEVIEIRKTYHSKISSIPIVEVKSDKDYHDINRLKAFKYFLEQVLEVELWKIDTIIKINNKWYNNIDPLLGKTFKTEQISYLKNYFDEGIKESYNFRQLTINYTKDQLSFINFLLERNGNLIQSDESMYNNLASSVENSSKLYRNCINDIYNNKLRRVKEFNLRFKYESVDKLIDIVTDGIIDGKLNEN